MSEQDKSKQGNPKPRQEEQPTTTASDFQSGERKAEVKAGKKAAADTAADARQEAQDVASALADKGKRSASNTADRLRDTVEEQKAAGAERAKGIAAAINRAADELEDEIPQAAHYVRRGAEELEHLSDEVRKRDAKELFAIAQDFSRRQPALVMGATALAGFAAVRFFMASAQPSEVSTTSSGQRADQTRSNPATQTGSSVRPDPRHPQQPDDEQAPTAPSVGATNVPGPSASSGDPGGISPQAPGTKTKPSGSSPEEE